MPVASSSPQTPSNNNSNKTCCSSKQTPSSTMHSSQATTAKTRCPHVVTIGNFSLYAEDIEQKHKLMQAQHHRSAEEIAQMLSESLKRQREQKLKSKQTPAITHGGDYSSSQQDAGVVGDIEMKSNENGNNGIDEEEEENSDEDVELDLNKAAAAINLLKCDECEQMKNLWLCLRADCFHIGCGQAEKKHGTIHAQNMYHPLSMNLLTKGVWCEVCEERIELENNRPAYKFRSRLKQQQQQGASASSSSTEPFEAFYHSISDDEQQQQQPPATTQKSHSLMDLELMSYLDDKNELIYDNEEELEASSMLLPGLVGLSNLGNTCYMNAALQALSNCEPFTAYFLECSPVVKHRLRLASTSSSPPHTLNMGGFSMKYMRLMSEIWNKSQQRRASSYSKSIAPSDLVQTVKFAHPMFRGYAQQDSQEFLLCVLDLIHEELKRHEIVPKKSDDDDDDEKAKKKKKKKDLHHLKQEEEETEEDDEEESDDDSIERDHTEEEETDDNEEEEEDEEESYETCGSDEDILANGDGTSNGTATAADDDEVFVSNKKKANGDLNGGGGESTSSSAPGDSGIQSLMSSKSNISTKQSLSSTMQVDQPPASAQQASTSASQPAFRVNYTSIISQIFEGEIISQVQCLECNHLSTTTETFQSLSLPIPTREYVQALQRKSAENQLLYRRHCINNNNNNSNNSDSCSSESETPMETQPAPAVPVSQYQSWLSWLSSYIWSPTIKLSECLTAFFSDDELRGDDMYSCEKCKKLTNGIKYSKVNTLPEILCIHLKRFKHDSVFSTGKINSFVSFPLDDLDMKLFMHSHSKSESTQYELISLIVHQGSYNGGHYICYAKNSVNDEWYEFDDSYCRQVSSLDVENAQAYVLFYKQKSPKMDSIREDIRHHIQSMYLSSQNSKQSPAVVSNSNSLLQTSTVKYISKQWLLKLKYFAEPGEIDNSDFLCEHNYVQPELWSIVESLIMPCSSDIWDYLASVFGVKRLPSSMITHPQQNNNHNHQNGDHSDDEDSGIYMDCIALQPCLQCVLNDEAMRQRQIYEKTEFIRLRDKWIAEKSTHIRSGPTVIYAISTAWFKQWESFVQSQRIPLRYQIPGKINNQSICVQTPAQQQQQQSVLRTSESSSTTVNTIYALNRNSKHSKLSEEMWSFLHGIYGGGPTLSIVTNHSSSSSFSSSPSSNISASNLSSSPNNKFKPSISSMSTLNHIQESRI